MTEHFSPLSPRAMCDPFLKELLDDMATNHTVSCRYRIPENGPMESAVAKSLLDLRQSLWVASGQQQFRVELRSAAPVPIGRLQVTEVIVDIMPN